MALMVNGERIEDTVIASVREQLAAQAASQGGEPEWIQNGSDLDTFAEDMIIAQALTRQEAKRRIPKVPQKDVLHELARLKQHYGGEQGFRRHLTQSNHTETQVKEDIDLSLRVDALLDEVCQRLVEPTDEEARAYYETHTVDFRTHERIHAAHIVKHAKDNVLDMQAAYIELEELVDQIKQGGSFKGLASRYSDCPDNGGDLGYFMRGTMVPEFEDVVFALDKGGVSGVFSTSFGLHVAKVYDKVPAQDRPFDEVVGEVKELLHRERENAAIDAFTAELRQHASIENLP